jgi:hypothetical protein
MGLLSERRSNSVDHLSFGPRQGVTCPLPGAEVSAESGRELGAGVAHFVLDHWG